MNKVRLSTAKGGRQRAQVVAEGGVAIALSLMLSQVLLYRLPQGGSITLGSMVPMWFFARRQGLRWGVFAGICVGGLQFCLTPAPILHWAQPILDYGLAYGAMGLAAIWPRLPLTSTFLAITTRFSLHVLSGMIFYRDFAFQSDSTPFLYSLAYNAAYLIPDALAAFWIYSLVGKRIEGRLGGRTKPGTSGKNPMHRADVASLILALLLGVTIIVWIITRTVKPN